MALIRPKFLLILILVLSLATKSASQGGPPMLTDDPGTPELRAWEVNTSFTSEITDTKSFSVPLLDINYGATERIQLKAEMPFLISENEGGHFTNELGAARLGIKYRFMDESKHHLSISTYPAITFGRGGNEYFLPAEFEKTFGNFTIGTEIGYLFMPYKPDFLINGNVMGYTINQATLLAEVYFEYNLESAKDKSTFLNFGFRYKMGKKFTLLTSIGTQILTPQSEQKVYIFSLVGLQSFF